MADKYGAKGYVLTRDEYETYKDRFISENNRLDRSQLIDLIGELPNLEENGILLHQEWLIGHQYHAQINIRVSLSNKFEFGSNCLIFQIFFENFEFVFFVAKLRFRVKWQ